MTKKNKIWPGMMLVAFTAGAASAADRGEFQLTPYLGISRIKIDGRNQEFGETERFKGSNIGITAGYRAPFGLLAEIGRSASGNPLFGWLEGGEMRERYGALGFDIGFGKVWHFIPKIGVTKWQLDAAAFEDLVDDSGELTKSLEGSDPYFELTLTRSYNPHVAIGLSLRSADVEFGDARSAAFRFIWSL